MELLLTSHVVLIFALFFHTIACLPNAIPRPAAKIDPPFKKIIRHNVLPQIPSRFAQTSPANALATRSQANATEPRVIYSDLTFLIPSQSHAALLSKMYSELRNAVLDAARDLEPAANLVLKLGMYTFTVVCLGKVVGWQYLIETALDILEEVALATYPITFSLLFFGSAGGVYWAAGFLDGS